LFPRVAKELKKRGIKDVLIVGGGTIPDEDKKALEKSGVTGNFGPGTSLDDVINHIKKGVSKLRKL
jgi:methylmalonyl-CoA mutase C-terminal domain/subunit